MNKKNKNKNEVKYKKYIKKDSQARKKEERKSMTQPALVAKYKRERGRERERKMGHDSKKQKLKKK